MWDGESIRQHLLRRLRLEARREAWVLKGADVAFCEHCGHEVLTGAAFCDGCGSPTASTSAPHSETIDETWSALSAEMRQVVAGIVIVLLLAGVLAVLGQASPPSGQLTDASVLVSQYFASH